MKILSIILALAAGLIPLKKGNDKAYVDGEKQVYIVHYKWGVLDADVAHAYTSLKTITYNGKKAYKVNMEGHTASIFEKLVKVRENFNSTFMADDYKPVLADRSAGEFKYWADNDYVYHWDKGYIDAKLSSSDGRLKDKHIPLEKGVMDVSTLFFAFRSIDLSKLSAGEKFTVLVALDDDAFPITFRYHGAEELNVKGMDRVMTEKFTVEVKTGRIFDPEHPITIYATTGEALKPIYFVIPLRLGRVVGHLESDSR